MVDYSSPPNLSVTVIRNDNNERKKSTYKYRNRTRDNADEFYNIKPKILNNNGEEIQKIHKPVKKPKNLNNVIIDKLTALKGAIYTCVPLCIDKDVFGYGMQSSLKKINKGHFTTSLKVFYKNNILKFKKLLFVVSHDIRTDNINVTIIDTTDEVPNILFVTSDEYPIFKIEKYLPSILESLQDILSKI